MKTHENCSRFGISRDELFFCCRLYAVDGISRTMCSLQIHPSFSVCMFSFDTQNADGVISMVDTLLIRAVLILYDDGMRRFVR